MKGLRIIDPGTDRASWLGQRRVYLTATQVAAIAGSHPYTRMVDVWNERQDPEAVNWADSSNPWLRERAALGVSREADILAWAGERLGLDVKPNSALVALPERAEAREASTPDGWASVAGRSKLTAEAAELGLSELVTRGSLVLVESKATQQRWDQKGLPLHVLDQTLWQAYTTGAAAVIVAAELYEWQGRGKDKTAVCVGTWLYVVSPADHERRLAFLLGQVAIYLEMEAADISPESDIDLSALEAPGFDATPEEVAEYAELETIRDGLAELERLDDEARAIADKVKAAKAKVDPLIREYEGRRVHFTTGRFTAKLIRYNKREEDTSALDAATLRSITSWTEASRLSYERTTP